MSPQHNRIKWQNALLCSGKQGPKGPVRLTLITMCTRADNASLEFFMTQHELAEWMGCSLSQAKVNVKKALESGWLVQTRKGNSRYASEYRLTIGATDNSDGVIPRPRHTGLEGAENRTVKGAENRTIKGAENRTPTTPVTTPVTTPKDIPSLQADEECVTANAGHGEAREINPNWSQNGSHVSNAMKLGISPLGPISQAFKQWARDNRVRSSDWDKKFGAFITFLADGDCDPEDKGFDGIGEYVAC